MLLAQGLSNAGEGIGRPSPPSTASPMSPDSSPPLSAAPRWAALVLKLGIRDLIPNLRHNALRRSRNLQKSLNQDAGTKLPQLIAPAQDADAQLESQPSSSWTGDDRRQNRPQLRCRSRAVRQATAAISGTNPATGQPYAVGYAGLPAELTALQERLRDDAEQAEQITSWLVTAISNLNRLSSTAIQLSDGLNQIQSAGRRLADGAARFASVSGDLNDQLLRAATAATALAGGIAQLGEGTSALQENLARAYTRSYPLQAGLRRATVRIVSTGRQPAAADRSHPALYSGHLRLRLLRPLGPRRGLAVAA